MQFSEENRLTNSWPDRYPKSAKRKKWIHRFCRSVIIVVIIITIIRHNHNSTPHSSVVVVYANQNREPKHTFKSDLRMIRRRFTRLIRWNCATFVFVMCLSDWPTIQSDRASEQSRSISVMLLPSYLCLGVDDLKILRRCYSEFESKQLPVCLPFGWPVPDPASTKDRSP